jgi:hypothetical protein
MTYNLPYIDERVETQKLIVKSARRLLTVNSSDEAVKKYEDAKTELEKREKEQAKAWEWANSHT